jgi:hypothetical protein
MEKYFIRYPEIRHFIVVLGLTAILSFVATLLIDPVWGYYDSYIAAMVSGQLSGVFINESYHLGLNSVIKLLVILHRHIPQIPWTAILLFLMWVYVQSISIVLILKWLNKGWGWKLVVLVWGVLLLFVFGFSFIEYSITGIGMLLSFISLIAIWDIQKTSKNGISDWACKVLLSIGFISGYCMRIESGLGGTVIAILFILLSERSLLVLLKAFVVPVFFSFLFFIHFYHTLNDHYFFRKVDPIVFYVTDSHNSPPWVAADSIEEIKIRLIKASVLIDSSQFNYEIYNKLASKKWEYEKKHTLRPQAAFRQIVKVAGPTIISNLPLTSVYLLVLTFSLIVMKTPRGRHFFPILSYNILWGLIICSLAYSMKMEKWHYIPLVQCAILGNIFYAISKAGIEKVTFGILKRSMFFILFVMLIVNYIISINQNHRGIDEKLKIANEIFKAQGEQLVFFDVNTREILDNYVFRNYHRLHNIQFYDIAQFAYLPEYEKHLNNLCHCNAHSAKDFFLFLKQNRNRIDYYSSSERVSLLAEFMRQLYGVNVVFRPVSRTELKEGGYGLGEIVKYKLEFPE